MQIMRPVRMEDLTPILELSQLTGFGLSTLPSDPEYLEERIDDSVRGFSHIAKKPRGESYLFVMEDLESHEIVGTSGIVSKVGGFEPFYAYRVETLRLESKTLNVDKSIGLLSLVTEYNGPTEIGSLFLKPDYQRRGLGQLLVDTRFLFMAEFPQHFESTVIAELRGIVDDHGYSPFWEALGRHFFDVDFPKADYLSMKNKQFIAELMPKHPIYIPLLPTAAQSVIGRVHEKTLPAFKRLKKEGFQDAGMVDIFEAGLILSCDRDRNRTIRESARATVDEIAAEEPAGNEFLVSNTSRDFRACYGRLQSTREGGVRLGRAVAEALHLAQGDPIRYVPLL